MSRAISWVAAISFAVLLPCAVTAAAPTTFVIDQVIPLSPDGRLAVSRKAGPVLINQILFQNLPTADEARDAVRPGERSRPHPLLVVTNPSARVARLESTVTLEDEDGTVYMTCAATHEVRGGSSNQLVPSFLPGVWMRTVDFRKVKVAHLVVRVELVG